MKHLAKTVAQELAGLRDVSEVEVSESGESITVKGLAKTAQGDRRFYFNMPPPISPLAAVGRVRQLCKTGG